MFVLAEYLHGKVWSWVDLINNENAVSALLFVAAFKYMICKKQGILHLLSAVPSDLWLTSYSVVSYNKKKIYIGRPIS